MYLDHLYSLLQKDEVYLNLVLEYIPETVYRVARHYSKSKQTIPILYIKVRNVEDAYPYMTMAFATGSWRGKELLYLSNPVSPQPPSHSLSQLYMYQLFRSLAYIHSLGICHRDIKPQNLLLDPESGVLKLCDFGSAKQLVRGEPNVSYICSRYYRAPELIFGATDYTSNIGTLS